MPLLYKPHFEETLERYRKFYCSPAPGQVLIHVSVPVPDRPPEPRMDEWDWDVQLEEYLDQWLMVSEVDFEASKDIQDDSIPFMRTEFGIAALSAYVAGEVLPGETTSWTKPVIKDWDDLKGLEISEDRLWFRRNVQATHYLAERARGRFAVEPRTCLGPLDLANALRGNALFTDFYEYPDEVRGLLDFCVRAAASFIEAQQRVVDEVVCDSVSGRILGWGGQWLPGRAFAMSDDVPDLCSPAMYREFGYKYDQQLIDLFGGALIHTHVLGVHAVPELMKLRGLLLLQIQDDPGQPGPIEFLEELMSKNTGGVALQLACRPEELEDNIKTALRGRVIFETFARDVDEANELVRIVRRYTG